MIETAIFETTVGWCALAWHDAGIVGACLPQANERVLVACWEQLHPGAKATRSLPTAAREMQAHLEGKRSAIDALVIDYTGVPEFHARVYVAARAIPSGETKTYGELANALGSPGAARAVGQALGKNPFAPIVPCHRILAAGRKMGGFSAPGGLATKQRLLEIEGAWPIENTSLAMFG